MIAATVELSTPPLMATAVIAELFFSKLILREMVSTRARGAAAEGSL